MEIAFFVIAVIGLLALSQGGGGSVSGQVNITPVGGVNPPMGTYVPMTSATPAPSTWTPTVPGNFGAPITPSTGANITGALFTGSAQVATSVLSKVGVAASAVPIVGTAIAVAMQVANAILQAHTKRLTGAKTENQAVDAWVPVFDSFVTQVNQAYNSGQINAQQAAQVCQTFDQTLYNKFKSFVGQPGTAWSDTSGMGGKCDKTCTVGCCIYYGDLGPVLNDISFILGYPTGKWGSGDPRISGRTITVPEVYPSQFSSYTRAKYTLTFN